MIFIKAKITDDVEIRVDLYGDEFGSYCPQCGREHDLDIETVASIINDGGDLGSTDIFCQECTRSRRS